MTRPHPTGGTKVTDPYGVPRPGGTTHTGTDFRAPTGTPLYASQSGTVKTGTSTRAGIWVEIHNGDTVVGYSHLSKRNVKSGQQVNAGDIIGWSGATGNVIGAHLHFYVKINGKSVDPEIWLNAVSPQPLPQPSQEDEVFTYCTFEDSPAQAVWCPLTGKILDVRSAAHGANLRVYGNIVDEAHFANRAALDAQAKEFQEGLGISPSNPGTSTGPSVAEIAAAVKAALDADFDSLATTRKV